MARRRQESVHASAFPLASPAQSSVNLDGQQASATDWPVQGPMQGLGSDASELSPQGYLPSAAEPLTNTFRSRHAAPSTSTGAASTAYELT